MTAPRPWTAEAVGRLRELAGEGLSSEAIGKQLGKSKNSIIGCARRRGIALTYRQYPSIPDWPPAQLLRTEQNFEQPKPAKPFTFGITELQSGQCRWPKGDSNFTFCGAPQVPGYSYCASHAAIAFNRPGVRAA